jgi:hypothetical protein
METRLLLIQRKQAHSNFWQGFLLENFEQFDAFRNAVNVPKFENMMAYRNREQGISTWSKLCGNQIAVLHYFYFVISS